MKCIPVLQTLLTRLPEVQSKPFFFLRQATLNEKIQRKDKKRTRKTIEKRKLKN